MFKDDAPSTLLQRLKCKSKSENNKKKGVGVRSLARNIAGAEGHDGALRWGLG